MSPSELGWHKIQRTVNRWYGRSKELADDITANYVGLNLEPEYSSRPRKRLKVSVVIDQRRTERLMSRLAFKVLCRGYNGRDMPHISCKRGPK